MIEGCQKTVFFNFWCQYSRSKINFTYLKFVFLLEYWIRQTTFISDIINFIHGLFSKSVPNFWRLLIKQSYMISKNPLRMSIWIQKSIEFHLPFIEFSQLNSTTVITLTSINLPSTTSPNGSRRRSGLFLTRIQTKRLISLIQREEIGVWTATPLIICWLKWQYTAAVKTLRTVT